MYNDAASNARRGQAYDETSLDRDLSAISDFGGMSDSGMANSDLNSA